jgi:hypothetical protein
MEFALVGASDSTHFKGFERVESLFLFALF